MEKKLFAFFIPLCIFGFLGFWISTMFVGTHNTSITRLSGGTDPGGDDWRCSHTLADEDFSAEMIANPEIELNLADVSATVVPYNGTNIVVEARNIGHSKLRVDLERIGGSSSRINIRSDSLLDFGFGLFKFNLFDGLADKISNRRITIKIPSNYIYEKIIISQGSGETNIKGIPALENDIDIGSGKLTYENSSSVVSQTFKIDLGSGEATFKGISTKNYEIDVGSGKLNIKNLTGDGKIDMGSGSADITFEDSPSGRLDMGSGYIKMTIPKETNTTFNFDIGSGWIDIEEEIEDHMKSYTRYSDDGNIVLGNGDFKYDIDLGSGRIEIAYTNTGSKPITGITITEPNVVQSSFARSESEYRSNN